MVELRLAEAKLTVRRLQGIVAGFSLILDARYEALKRAMETGQIDLDDFKPESFQNVRTLVY